MAEEVHPAELARRARNLLESYFSGQTQRLRETVLDEAFQGFRHNPRNLLETTGSTRDFAVHCVAILLDFGCCDGHRHSLARLLEVIGKRHQGARPHPDYLELPRCLNEPCALPSRAEERAYLEWLRAGIEHKAVLYSPLSGVARVRPKVGLGPLHGAWDDLAALQHLQRPRTNAPPVENRQYPDILSAFESGRVRQAALLGQPGAGKSTTLRKLAMELVGRAEQNANAPIPVLVSLGDWTDAQELTQFLSDSRHVPVLGETLIALARHHRLVLLLDGLNEIPTGQREAKVPQVRRFLHTLGETVPVYVACRSDDYPDLDLGLDTLTLEPLAPPRVREVLHHWFRLEYGEAGEGRAERLFWQLAGDPALADVLTTWLEAGADERLFWSAETIPREAPNVWGATSGAEDVLWERYVRNPRSLIRLAANPFMLTMLFRVWYFEGETLPRNRGELFTRFADTLLHRERLANLEPATGTTRYTAQGRRLLDGLATLAWSMQTRRIESEGAAGSDAGVLTVVPRDEVKATLGDEALVRKAEDATFLEGGGELRFRHQLLQEYFSALAMRLQLEQGRLDARRFWPPPHWWARSGWEEATLLLAGLYAEDCTPVIRWLQETQPERAAECLVASGAETANREALLADLQAAWLPRLTDTQREPAPEARAAVGRALGRLGLDNRQGVGLDARGLPDIDWVPIPAGEFIYQTNERRHSAAFWIARYPVTQAQYEAFIRDEGYAEGCWWEGLHERIAAPSTPRWSYPNHPRETVNWYEAMAYCAWLSERLGLDCRLPTESQWERAARGCDGRLYPWGNEYRPGHANIDETWGGDASLHYLQQTTPVGIYPQGASLEGVLDLSGNVWEWCLDEYDRPGQTGKGGEASRVLRGGSWIDDQDGARADDRGYSPPHGRGGGIGFRVVCVCPPSAEP